MSLFHWLEVTCHLTKLMTLVQVVYVYIKSSIRYYINCFKVYVFKCIFGQYLGTIHHINLSINKQIFKGRKIRNAYSYIYGNDELSLNLSNKQSLEELLN